ncbi:MAG: ribonuclease HII [Candidatus Yanofskybacteria bacterium]|nr:ribonuclease HII [Candidatus Yanofskybacteria bacterium]
MKLPSKTLERKLFAGGYRCIVAVDEVGMGCLAGPVVVCAVSFNKDFFKKSHKKLRWLRDSKQLLPHQREKFAAELLKQKNFHYQISYCHSKTIDKINIYQAARKAMGRAVRNVISYRLQVISKNSEPTTYDLPVRQSLGAGGKPKTIILVDGKTKIQGMPLEQRAIVKGDRKVFAIACASILAKVFRDKMMVKYAKKFPGYGFEKHKGYGTKEHQVRLAKLGPCPIHRRSFWPVSNLI